jgi:hypothetical protein
MLKFLFMGMCLAVSVALIGWAGSSFVPVFGIVNCTNWAGLADKDCDQLADTWETSPTGYSGLILKNMGADPNVKDIFVEIDYRGHHKPRSGVVEAVTTAFANSQVANVVGYPTGIRLHVFVDENIGDPPTDPCTNGWTEFNSLKNTWFGTASERSNPTLLAAKRNTFHYALFIHTQCANPPASGTSEILGNDLMISLGYPGWGTDPATGKTVGSVAQQEGTFMHELGHNLNLRHGGSSDINCKPNYLSVMNWAFQFPVYTTNPNFPDYSRWLWSSLNESNLTEPTGIGTSGYQTAIGGGIPPNPLVKPFVPTGSPIDYNDNRASTDLHVVRNLNNFGYSGTISESNCNSNTFTTLFGYKDWGDLLKYWGVGGEFSNGTSINQTAAQDSGKLGEQEQVGIASDNNLTQTSEGNGNFTHTDVTIQFVKGARLQIVQDINREIQMLPDAAFKDPEFANKTRANFEQELLGSSNSSIANLTQSDELGAAIDALTALRQKMDSTLGGSAKDDLIVDPKAQEAIARLIDNFIEVLAEQR